MVYENTPMNYVYIVAMLCLFYFVMFFHWYANYSLGIHDTETCTLYNIIIFITAIINIGLMLCYGATVNSKKITHEYYAEKISEAKIRAAEKAQKDA